MLMYIREMLFGTPLSKYDGLSSAEWIDIPYRVGLFPTLKLLIKREIVKWETRVYRKELYHMRTVLPTCSQTHLIQLFDKLLIITKRMHKHLTPGTGSYLWGEQQALIKLPPNSPNWELLPSRKAAAVGVDACLHYCEGRDIELD